MRISDEIDALEVMGIPPVTFLAATRLLGAWIAFPFIYLVGIGVMYFASYFAVVDQVGDVSSGGYLLIFWMFQNPLDLIFSLIKGMVMATVIVLVGCYYGYTASGGPVGVGTATAQSMVVNIILVHIIGMLGTVVFWGATPRAPIWSSPARGASSPRREGEVDEATGGVVVLVRLEEQVLRVDDHDEGEAAAQAGDVDPLLVVRRGVDVGPADRGAEDVVVDVRVLVAAWVMPELGRVFAGTGSLEVAQAVVELWPDPDQV